MATFDDYPTLQSLLWQAPDDYAGEQHFGKALIASIHRDSDILSQSNWDALLATAGGESPYLQIKRASHWGFGWVDHMLLSPRAPDKIKEDVERALNALSDYPVLNDEDYSRREWEATEELWNADREWTVDRWNQDNPSNMVPFEAAELSLSELFHTHSDLYEHLRVLATE